MTRPEAELFPTVLQPGIAPRALAHLHDIVSDFLLAVDGAKGEGDGTEGPPEGAVRPGGGRSGRTPGRGEAGAPFVGYDWCTTATYDDSVPEHRDLIRSIECSNAMPRMGPFSEVRRDLELAGFVDVKSSDRAEDADAETPWYRPLESLELSLKSLPRTPFGRRITSSALSILESLRLVPPGSRDVQEVLNVAADSIVAAGRLGIFTPMFFHSAHKPGNLRS